jgi:hypothetical protein
MIKLKDILQESWYGNLLWADDAYSSSSAPYRDVISKAYRDKREPDTPFEREVWRSIQNYLKGDYDRDAGLGSRATPALKDLLALKQKFPEILDPGIASGAPVYRAMTMPTEDLAQLIEAEANKGFNRAKSVFNEWHSVEGLSMRAKSRSNYGFISMTSSKRVAQDFYGNISYKDRYPVILECAYADVQKRALMNSEWIKAVAGLDESEFWVIGNVVPVNRIWFRDPEASFNIEPKPNKDRIQQAMDTDGIIPQ